MANIDDIERLNAALIEDADLRQRFREEPVAVVESFGIQLSDESKLVLTSETWVEKTEEELDEILRRRIPGICSWF